MVDLIELLETPVAEEIYMIAGWHQWADAGEVSSGLPHYLIAHTHARKIGEIKPRDFYLFQIPGTHHLLRPEVSLHDGYRQNMMLPKNEFFYSGNDKKGLVLFLGNEPHLNAEEYADALLDVAQQLNVKRAIAVGGVFGAVPYDKDRQISCSYSLRHMKDELAEYAVAFSNYEGGISISTFLIQRAEERGLEMFGFYPLVPAYNFSPIPATFQGLRIDKDYRAWYELMRRLNHMFGLSIDLSELSRQSENLTLSMEGKVEELKREIPDVDVDQVLEEITGDFIEQSFMPLDDVWERELGDIIDDLDD